ncbi:hypothetical protein [Carboxylicivirga sp. N1Y90]
MNYLHQVLWYMALPLTIVVSYYAVRLALKIFHKKLEAQKDQ